MRDTTAAQRQSGLAFDLVAKDRDGREIVAERHLVKRQYRPGRDAEILPACLAAEPERTGRAAALIDSLASAIRADLLSLGHPVVEMLHRYSGRDASESSIRFATSISAVSKPSVNWP
jgi:hypothetical protein